MWQILRERGKLVNRQGGKVLNVQALACSLAFSVLSFSYFSVDYCFSIAVCSERTGIKLSSTHNQQGFSQNRLCPHRFPSSIAFQM